MNELYQKTFDFIQEYESYPVYTCQINKVNCRLIIELEGNKDYRFTENNGESMMLPLNYLLITSGKQRFKIKIYPYEHQPLIDKAAHIQLKFYAAQKESSLNDYRQIKTFEFSMQDRQEELPYYETIPRNSYECSFRL